MNYIQKLREADILPPETFDSPPQKRSAIVENIHRKLSELGLHSHTNSPVGGFQDAAHYAQIVIPHRPDEISRIVFSKAGGLVGISNEQALGKNTKRVIELIESHGGVYIPESLLRSPYIGQEPGYDSWWHRFLDYQ